MAKPINHVTVAGNITRDLDMRLAGGTTVLNFGIAVNHSKKVDGEWQDDPNFFDVTVFGDLAEQAAETFSKGDRVVVTGRLSYRSWETQEGDKRSKVEILANNLAVDLTYATATINKVQRTDG